MMVDMSGSDGPAPLIHVSACQDVIRPAPPPPPPSAPLTHCLLIAARLSVALMQLYSCLKEQEEDDEEEEEEQEEDDEEEEEEQEEDDEEEEEEQEEAVDTDSHSRHTSRHSRVTAVNQLPHKVNVVKICHHVSSHYFLRLLVQTEAAAH